jgi:hypothetical protein
MNLIDQTIAATVQARTTPIFGHHGDEKLSASAAQEKAFSRLDAYIRDGQARAKGVVERIMGEQPLDRYVRAASPMGVRLSANDKSVDVLVGGAREQIAPHALDQLATRAGMNLRYLHDLQGHQADWSAHLAALNVNTLLAHEDEATKYLVRSVGGRVRGVMSDAYKRMDSRPEVDAMIGAALGAGAVIVNGIYTETRVDLKIVRAKPIEVFPGEYMVFGLDYSNSDYGDGAREYRAFLLRLICLNGAVASTELRKIHIGKRFEGAEGIASAETLDLDARAQASLAQDTVKALLSEAATDHIVGQIRAANAKEIAPAKIESFLKTRVGKGDAEKITEKFASADVIEVPPGQNAWRFSNAISWLARETDDGRKKMDLERLAGEAMAL